MRVCFECDADCGDIHSFWTDEMGLCPYCGGPIERLCDAPEVPESCKSESSNVLVDLASWRASHTTHR